MFTLTVFGFMLLAASLIALARRHGQTKKDRGPIRLGLSTFSRRE